jgi:hypothetical protein
LYVEFFREGDGTIQGEVTWEPHCIINPEIVGTTSEKLEKNLEEFTRLLNRYNYLEVLLHFMPLGIGVAQDVIQDIYIGQDRTEIYGITLEHQYIKLLGGKDRVDLFNVYDQPDIATTTKFRGYYSNGKLNLRDCIPWYPITIPESSLIELKEKERDLGMYFTINRWVNNKFLPESIDFGLTTDQMIGRLDAIVKWEKLLGACYHNVEKYSSIEEVPMVMNQIITGVESSYARHYLYLLNCILQKSDDIAMENLFLTIRYLLAHEIRRCEQK